MLTDTTILHRHGGYEVLAEPQLVRWPNGSTVTLHRVCFHGYVDMFLRACRADDLHWVIFDLRDITPSSFELDVRSLPARDTDGVVLYGLRLNFTHAEQFTGAALANFKAAWFVRDEVAA